MDIHPPHPIHSWRDFGVQLVTIAAGILIALSFEGVREALHDRALVREVGLQLDFPELSAASWQTAERTARRHRAVPGSGRLSPQLLFIAEQLAAGVTARCQKALE